jgi:hypothetical protein
LNIFMSLTLILKRTGARTDPCGTPLLIVTYSVIFPSTVALCFLLERIRGYYTAARRYDFYLRVVKTIFYERAQRVSKILFLTRDDKNHIFKPPCNVLFIV